MSKKNNLNIIIVILIILVVFASGYFAKKHFLDEVNLNVDKKAAETNTQVQPQQQTSQQSQPSIAPQLTADISTPSVKCSQPTGEFTILYSREKNKLNEVTGWQIFRNVKDNVADARGIFKYTGNCIATIYIEAGMPNAPQSQLLSLVPDSLRGFTVGSPSSCDGNVHYNGYVFKNVQPGQQLKFQLNPENYGVDGTYPLLIQAWTGCEKDGGKLVADAAGKAAFSDSYSIPQVQFSYVQLK